MLQILPKHRVFIAVKPIDFRCGIDAIAAICKKQLLQDPASGHLFLFRNRRGNSIKMIAYDYNGFFLCQKRLSYGTFKSWPSSPQAVLALTLTQLHLLLYNGNPPAPLEGPPN
jgi:transposase